MEFAIWDVIVGAVPEESVRIEFMGDAETAARADLPHGEILMLVRAKQGEGESGIYRPVNSFALWAESERGELDQPLREDPPSASDPFTSEVMRNASTVQELADWLETTIDRLDEH